MSCSSILFISSFSVEQESHQDNPSASLGIHIYYYLFGMFVFQTKFYFWLLANYLLSLHC